MKNLTDPVVIISAYRKQQTALENAQATGKLHDALQEQGFDFCESMGHYEDEDESTYTVLCDSADKLFELRNLGNKFQQAWVLYVDSQRSAWEVLCSPWQTNNAWSEEPSLKYIGRFKGCDKEFAMRLKAWTYQQGQYYYVEGAS